MKELWKRLVNAWNALRGKPVSPDLTGGPNDPGGPA